MIKKHIEEDSASGVHMLTELQEKLAVTVEPSSENTDEEYSQKMFSSFLSNHMAL